MYREESCFPDDYVNVRVQANTSYQIKRVIAQLEKEKGLVLMSISGILPNTGKGPRLRMFATFRDLKYEKKRKIRRLGIGLAMEGVKVLLVDLDPQGSLTASLGYKEPDSIEWKKSKGIVSSIEKNL